MALQAAARRWDPKEQLKRLERESAGVPHELLDFEGSLAVLRKLVWKGITRGRSLEVQLGDVMIRVFAPEPEMSVGASAHPEIRP